LILHPHNTCWITGRLYRAALLIALQAAFWFSIRRRTAASAKRWAADSVMRWRDGQHGTFSWRMAQSSKQPFPVVDLAYVFCF
jgi:hypothetical protein